MAALLTYLIQSPAGDGHSAAMHWGNIIAAVTLVVTVLSIILGVFFRLLKQNISSMFQLTAERNDAAAKEFSIKLEAAAEKYETRLESIKRDFEKALDANAARDTEAYGRLTLTLADLNKQLNALEKDYRSHLASLPMSYVQRDDWIREFSKVDSKLDAIWQEIHEQTKRSKRTSK